MKVKAKYSLSHISTILIYTLTLSIIVLTHYCHAQEGKVVGVSDGDTITILHSGKNEKKGDVGSKTT